MWSAVVCERRYFGRGMLCAFLLLEDVSLVEGYGCASSFFFALGVLAKPHVRTPYHWFFTALG